MTNRKPATNEASASPQRKGEGRVRRSQENVLRTTFEVLAERGLDGLSVDEIARRSGVAKTTIYRHWPTRAALVVDACTRIVAEQKAPDTGSLKGDLTAILIELAELLWSARWSSVLPSIVDAAERDATLATVHAQIQAGHAAPLRAVLERGMKQGDIPSEPTVATLVPALLGPLFYRRWFSREPIDETFVSEIVERVIPRPPQGLSDDH